jgi:hypothetical protein
LLAASNVSTKLTAARQLLDNHAHQTTAPSVVDEPSPFASASRYVRLYRELTGVDLRCCPSCGAAAMIDQPLKSPPRAQGPGPP